MLRQADQGIGDIHLRVIYRVLSTALHGDSVEDVHQAALEAIQQIFGVKAASILLFDADGVMRFQAWRSLSADYRAATEGHSPWKPDSNAEPILISDVYKDDSLSSLRQVILDEGIRALAFIPLLFSNRLIGKFMLYYGQPHEFTEEELSLAEILAGHVAMAVRRHSWEAEITAGDAASLYLDAIVTSSDDAIVGKNLDGIVQSWNKGAERLFGYTAKEAEGRSIRMIIPPDRQQEEDEVLSRIRKGQRTDHFETVRVRKDGSLVEISLTVSPIKNRKGDIIGASKIARDLTERRKADRLATQFLGLVSHELRTPLATIYGDSLLLRDKFGQISTDDRRSILDDLVAESARLQRLIENMLLLTRLEAEGLELEELNLQEVVLSVVNTFTSRNADAAVDFSMDGSAPRVSANLTYLESVLENLLSNAAKYSPENRQVQVVLSSPGGDVELRVLDRGVGIADEDAERLFTPFYRAKRAREVASGMGVGLALCKRVIEAQGGTVWALPRPGGGSEFGFSLPRISRASGDLDD